MHVNDIVFKYASYYYTRPILTQLKSLLAS